MTLVFDPAFWRWFGMSLGILVASVIAVAALVAATGFLAGLFRRRRRSSPPAPERRQQLAEELKAALRRRAATRHQKDYGKFAGAILVAPVPLAGSPCPGWGCSGVLVLTAASWDDEDGWKMYYRCHGTGRVEHRWLDHEGEDLAPLAARARGEVAA